MYIPGYVLKYTLHIIMPARKLIGDIFAYCRVFVMSYVLNICEGGRVVE